LPRRDFIKIYFKIISTFCNSFDLLDLKFLGKIIRTLENEERKTQKKFTRFSKKAVRKTKTQKLKKTKRNKNKF